MASSESSPAGFPRLRALLRRANLPAFTLACLLLFDLLILFLLLAGGTDTALGRFARDFQAWCFRADPETGRLDWLFPGIFFGESALLGGLILAIWGRDLKAALSAGARGRRNLLVPLSTAMAVTALAAYALVAVGRVEAAKVGEAADAGTPEFPAEDLRTAIPLHAFALTDQAGLPAAAPDPDGHVLLITAFYAHCVSTCPAIFRQVQAVVDSLPPEHRDRVRVLAITMDPERDSPARLHERAEALGLPHPAYRLLTGAPDTVKAVLDRLDFSRKRNDTSGEIEHANLMLLVDAQGRIAYRFSLGGIQEAWMTEALRRLAREAAPPRLAGPGADGE